MSAQHTPGLVVHSTVGYPKPDVVSKTGRAVARTWNVCSSQPKTTEQYERRTAEDRANARRIVACWNACDGISTEELERRAGMSSPAPAVAWSDSLGASIEHEEVCTGCYRRDCNGECMGDGQMGD